MSKHMNDCITNIVLLFTDNKANGGVSVLRIKQYDHVSLFITKITSGPGKKRAPSISSYQGPKWPLKLLAYFKASCTHIALCILLRLTWNSALHGCIHYYQCMRHNDGCDIVIRLNGLAIRNYSYILHCIMFQAILYLLSVTEFTCCSF